MIRVLVADDHAVIRRGILRILKSAPDIVIVGEASTGRETVKLVNTEDCDVLLLDVNMPDGDAFEILPQLKKFQPNLQALILTMYPEEQYAIRALKAGAAGYLTKDSTSEIIISAIRQVAQGHKYMTYSLAQSLATALVDETKDKSISNLSDHEYQVMCCLVRGLSVSEIAKELLMSVKTVNTYRRRVLDKLGLKNTPEIIRYAIERGLYY